MNEIARESESESEKKSVANRYVAHGMLCVMLFKETIEIATTTTKSHTNHLIRSHSISIDITSICPNAFALQAHKYHSAEMS